MAGESALESASRPDGEHERVGVSKRPGVLRDGRRLAGVNPVAGEMDVGGARCV